MPTVKARGLEQEQSMHEQVDCHPVTPLPVEQVTVHSDETDSGSPGSAHGGPVFLSDLLQASNGKNACWIHCIACAHDAPSLPIPPARLTGVYSHVMLQSV